MPTCKIRKRSRWESLHRRSGRELDPRDRERRGAREPNLDISKTVCKSQQVPSKDNDLQVNKYGVKNHFTNLSSLLTYDATGEVDYTDKFDAFDDAYSFAEEDAGTGILTNSQDRDFRSAFNLGGWKPKGDAQAMAIEVREKLTPQCVLAIQSEISG